MKDTFYTLLTYFAAPQTDIKITPGDLNLGQGAPTDVGEAQIEGILTMAYLVAGMVAVIVIVIAGIRFAAANGDSNQVQAAKNMVFYGVVGLVVIIAAAGITQFVLTNVTK